MLQWTGSSAWHSGSGPSNERSRIAAMGTPRERTYNSENLSLLPLGVR